MHQATGEPRDPYDNAGILRATTYYVGDWLITGEDIYVTFGHMCSSAPLAVNSYSPD